jgi:hypothetical protein
VLVKSIVTVAVLVVVGLVLLVLSRGNVLGRDSRAATTDDCVNAWNHGSTDGKPLRKYEGHSPGMLQGFIGRRAAVLTVGGIPSRRSCEVLFERGRYVVPFRTGSTGYDPLPVPDIGDWESPRTVFRKGALPAYPPFPGWNACQNDDGTIVLLAHGSCTAHDPAVRRLPIVQPVVASQDRTLVEALRAFPPGRHLYWLGGHFAGAKAEGGTAEKQRAGARIDYAPRNFPVTLIQVLTYTRRLPDAPTCPTVLNDCRTRGSAGAGRLITRLNTPTQTILALSLIHDDPISPRTRRLIHRALRPIPSW